jgi:hypothetical protein
LFNKYPNTTWYNDIITITHRHNTFMDISPHYVAFPEKSCMIMHSMRNLSWFPIPAAQELRYVEFFAGKGEVFSAVRAGGTPAMAVDIEYMTGRDHAFDINSVSGLPFLCCTSLKSHIY